MKRNENTHTGPDVAVRSGYRVLNPTVTNAVPAHSCVFEGADPPDDSERHTCPCCGDDSLCPCRCVSTSLCACVTCGHPYETGSPTNSAGEPMGVRSRAHRLLRVGGEPDQVDAKPQSADGTSADGHCPFCGCTQSGSPAASLPALAWRRTGGLASSPSSLATSGVFTVTGVSPSGRAGDGVFTWRAGSIYSRGRYTVVSLGAAFANAATNTAPVVQAGHTNTLSVLTAVPADGGTLSFSYNPFYAKVSVKNLRTGLYDDLPVLAPVPAADWLGTYASTDTFEADVRYVAAYAGDHAFGITYSQDGCTPESVCTNMPFKAVRIVAEPVTSDLAGGYVCNPSGLPLGSDGPFRISIADGTVPDDDIAWTVKEGGVSLPDGGTGPGVTVHADALGAFKLEADVKGLVITSPNVRPFFTGEVLPAVTVPVTVFIVRREDGSLVRNTSDIPDLLADANKILRQRGLSLVQNGDAHILNQTNWLDHTDLLNPANTNLYSMLNTTNSMGQALELYFVNTLDNGDIEGVRLDEGIVIATRGNGLTIAHETLHDCGTADIYTVKDQNAGDPISGPISQDRLPSDWSGGYYPPDLTQRELVSRLIMRSGGIDGVDTAFPRDLPTGTVFGWRHSNPADPSSTITLGQAGVGQSVIQGTPGSY